MPKADQILRKFILDAVTREHILLAWLHDEVTLENAASVHLPEETVANQEEQNAEESVPDMDKIRQNIKEILQTTLADVSPYMRPMDEVLDSVFFVIEKETIETLDGVGLFIHRAFTNLFGEKVTVVDKHVAFNLLVTKYEAYLKKLYYLMEGREVAPRFEGDPITWKDVLHAIPPLWELKYNHTPAI